jgi:hypothetical protein
MNEKELQQNVIDTAAKLGYRHYHTHDSRRSDTGFPDLCLVSRDRRRVIWIECKSAAGRCTPEQEQWQDELALCDEEVYVVRPGNLEEITEILLLTEKPGPLVRCRYDCAVVYYEEAPHA